MAKRTTRVIKGLLYAACAAAALVPATATAQGDARVNYNVRSRDMGTALTELARQANREIYFPAELTRGLRAPQLRGQMTLEQALEHLLRGSGLSYRLNSSGAIVIARSGATSPRAGEAEAAGAAADSESADPATPEILVQGRRTQNVDIRRTENDTQPYVIFDRQEIERSQASNLEDFFRSRLPMNSSSRSSLQQTEFVNTLSIQNSASSVNLRGLGVNQTLILVDGRRLPRLTNLPGATTPDLGQADINGIPLSAIERIEVLPSTAGGIYGGGAVGGVINIIRRRDYNGLDFLATYGGTTRGGGEEFRVDLNGGFSFGGGRTRISFSAAYAGSRPLYVGDNDLWRTGRDLINANDPNGLTLPAGSTPNILAFPVFSQACQCSVSPNLIFDNGTPLNANHTFVPVGYRGLALDGIAPLLANAGRYNLELSDDTLGRFAPLRNNPLVRSANFNARQEFTNWLEGFLDLSINDNRGRTRAATVGQITLLANAPNNPFRQDILVRFPVNGFDREIISRTQTIAATGGIITRLWADWTATGEYSWSRARNFGSSTNAPLSPAGLTALGNGTLDVIRDVTTFPIDLSPYSLAGPDTYLPFETRQKIASVRASGSIFDLPGGPLSLTMLAEHRSETAEQFRQQLASSLSFGFFTSDFTFPERSQSVDSAYAELRAPLISHRNAIPFIDELELQASIRRDEYRTRTPNPSRYNTAAPPSSVSQSSGTIGSTDFTIALRWAPSSDVSFRVSYGTGFLPPSIAQLIVGTSSVVTLQSAALLDPLRGNQPLAAAGPYTFVRGTNPNLRPELSESLSMGLVVTPRFLTGLRLSADYTQITKSDEIGLVSPQSILADESSFPGRVVRGSRLSTDPSTWAGPVTLLDSSLVNIARSRVRAWDVRADYRFDAVGAGNFHVFGLTTLQTELRRQLTPTSTSFDTVGFSDGPLKWRGNAGIDWAVGRWQIGWGLQYYHSYSVRLADPLSAAQSNLNVLRQGTERVPSQMYHDAYIRFRFGEHSNSVLSNLELAIGVQNIFDRRPPPIAATSLSNSYSPYGDPRLRRFMLTLRKTLNFVR